MTNNVQSDGTVDLNFDRAALKDLKKSKKDAQKKLKAAKFENKKNIEFNISGPKKTLLNAPKVIYNFQTSSGEKKNVSCDLPDSYHPLYVEASWYDWWIKQRFFSPVYKNSLEEINKINHSEKFVMLIPPPNVTGTLHLGHALMCSIQDVLARWNRMSGKVVLWNPGTDHAGIATQVVVEKKLRREKNVGRLDIGRDNFVHEVWNWKEEKGNIISDQMRKLGISVDWTRCFFTMDSQRSKAVEEAFIRLYNSGHIYRAKRLVNWSCTLNSAISDIEVDKIEINARELREVPGYTEKVEFGVLVYFNYKLEGSDQFITVATTRIETMLGDVAIAVNPNDPKYHNFVGKYAIHPFCNRKIKIISDLSVDINFGTGAVKITPAHDQNDYEIGLRHNLEMINIFTENGSIVDSLDFKDDFFFFAKMPRFTCRRVILVELKKLGLFVETKDHAYVIPVCNRSKDIVEPVLKSQWFVRCRDLANKASQVVKDGQLIIRPSTYNKTWFNWMDNIQDWCISRQLWWGHRIPAYYVTSQKFNNGSPDDSSFWVCASNINEARRNAASKFNLDIEEINVERDSDVLDTWFSSALLPFSIFGWPESTDAYKALFPTTLLETGYDILFFWVARMVILSLQLTDKLPFRDILLHPIVRDSHGRKMSKSLGNIVDPIDVIHGVTLQDLFSKLKSYNLDDKEFERAKKGQEADYPNGIPECGTDALRFALCAYSGSKKDINLDVLRIQGYRFFCNKIWNAVKFSLKNMDKEYNVNEDVESLNDRWILSRLSFAVDSCNEGFKLYDLASASTAIYNFWLYDFCDIYLESIKPILNNGSLNEIISIKKTLFICADNGLRLLHPFMPYISEELYQRLPFDASHFIHTPSICISSYPSSLNLRDLPLENDIESVKSLLNVIRSTKDEYVPSKTKVDVYISCHTKESYSTFNKFHSLIQTLSNSLSLYIQFDSSNIPRGCAISSLPSCCDIHIMFRGSIDINKEINRTEEKITKCTQQITRLEEATKVAGYTLKVPTDVQQLNSKKLDDFHVELQKLQKILSCLRHQD